MESGAVSIGQRLARLRMVSEDAHRSVRPAGHARTVDVAQVARAVGGIVAGDGSGQIAVIDEYADVAVDRRVLDALPFGVGSGRPLVAIDTETTGLATAAGTIAFLVGIGTWIDGRLRVRQLLLPDHPSEPAFLTALADEIPADAWLVSYNGRSFDWPLLVARFRMHRRDAPTFCGHLDLLHVARQLWKHRLGNARLATVERAICRVRRVDDMPGALIPDRYFVYLREGRADLLRAIVDHNRQDIVSLALLLSALTRLADPARWAMTHPGDVGALGRAYARDGDNESALACLDAALSSRGWEMGAVTGGSLWRKLAVDRARLLARAGRREDAAVAWVDIGRRGGPGSASAWLQVARHREHVERDLAGALDACRQALGAAERARMWGRAVPAIERDLAVRMARLRRRVAAGPTAPPAYRAA